MQVYTHEHVNDRIKVISFHLNNRSNIPTARPSLLTVINAYAPHSILETTHPEEADKFFHQLQITTHKYRYSTLLFIAGDLNAKIGRKLDESETFVGHYSKKYGSRNENGDRLAQFSASNDLSGFHPLKTIRKKPVDVATHLDEDSPYVLVMVSG
jgi:hypothetical protein